jgi:hypothetical protein
MEALAVGGLEVGDHRTVEHHDPSRGARLVDDTGQLGQEVAGQHGRRVGASHLDGHPEALAALVLLRPDEVGEPGHRVVVGHRERVEVDAGPPRHSGNGDPFREAAGHLAGQTRALPRGDQSRLRRPGVGVAVGVEAQSGARPNLDERQGLLTSDRRERRGQGRQTAHLVGLGRAAEDRRPDAPVVCEERLAKTGVGTRCRDAVPAGGREDQVRLLLDLRQLRQQGQDVGIVGDAARPAGEAGRLVPGPARELGVLLGDRRVGLHQPFGRET